MASEHIGELKKWATDVARKGGDSEPIQLVRALELVSKNFGLQPHEVAILGLTSDGRSLRFLAPDSLRTVGQIPLSSTNSLAARTVREKRPELINHFSVVPHASVFEAVPIADEQRRRLQVDQNEPVKFRHVELACGDRVLSEADNWYVPSRLTAEMNRSLETTDTPFGRAIAELKPFRQTFAVEVLWKPLEEGWEQRPPTADRPQQALAIPPKLFGHRALVYTPDLKPISEVDEIYTRENLAFAPPG